MASEGLPNSPDEAALEAQHAGLPRRFLPQRKLGAGGFGTVYAAWDEERAATVAVKRLERMDAASIYRFKQEFRVLAGRTHPNLVKLHGLFNEGSTWCLSMDWIDGVRFDTWIRGDASRFADHVSTRSTNAEPAPLSGESTIEQAPLAPEPFPSSDSHERLASGGANHSRLRAALSQLVEGVLALHDSGIIHRDLKPSNVLVSGSGHLTILDFGLAVASDSRDASDKNGAGTPAYMSPEQARGAALTVASDWYSVGVMLYEALVGHPPFAGTAADILAAKRSRDVRDPRLERPELPEDLCALALELLRRDPTARPHGVAIARHVGLSPSVGPRRKHVLGGPFVGRARELDALRGAFELARGGRTVVAHVQGSSGSGKTTVVRRFVAELTTQHDDVVVLEGRCFERESVPFKALDDLVDALGGISIA
jgi:serine/threonine protein kinase